MTSNSSSRTYAGQGYEVTYFARKHRITRQQARTLIRKHGHDREALNSAAIELKRSQEKVSVG